MESSSDFITEEEAALYDRQIRLWGADAQKRIRAANVLLAGFRGILTEVCKNLVLAGVNNVTILDQDPVQASDLGAQFFLREEDQGKSREVALERIQLLNPQANLSFECASIADKEEQYLTNFSVICVSNQPLCTIAKVNGICRRRGIPFYATDSFGYQAFFFADLAGHGYVVEEEAEKSRRKGQDEDDVEPPLKRQCSKEASLQKTGTVPAASPLAEIVEKANWGLSSMRRVPKLFFALTVLYQLQPKHAGRPIAPGSNELKELLERKNALLKEHKLRDSFFTDDSMIEIAKTRGAELSPICAIVGGILGQQVIKVLSAKGEPEVHNMFFYDARTAMGIVETFSV